MLTLGMFGYFYETPYGRDVHSRIIIKGLKRNGVNIVDVREKSVESLFILVESSKIV
jgi:hypothetical protein